MPELSDYKIRVENFYGPLDLLLHLVRETEVDITRIALAKVAEQYVAFLEAMQELDIELAGEFLVVASQLLLIKSRTLVPPTLEENPEEEPEEEEGEASLDLLRKLLDYKRFKDRARALGELAEERSVRFGRPRMRLEGETEETPLKNIDVWEIVSTWSRVSKSTRLDVPLSILYHDVPLEVFLDRILKAVAQGRTVTFSELLEGNRERGRIVGTFLAILQLTKDQRLRLEQDVDRGEILLRSA